MEYDKIFQPVMENGASRHLMMAENPNILITVDTLVEGGTIVGQAEMLSADVYYYLNPEKANHEVKMVPLFRPPTPEERINRPADTREGRRQSEAMGRPSGWGQVAVAPLGGRSGWGNS